MYVLKLDWSCWEDARKAGTTPLPSRAHLHYILEAEGFETLVTHIFDPVDPYIHSDAVFGVKESLLAKFELIEDPARIKDAGFEGPYYEVVHDFVLAPAK